MNNNKQNIGNLPSEVFDAVALLHIYFHVDCAYPTANTPKKREKLWKLIQSAGYLTDIDLEKSSLKIKEMYDEAVEEYAKNILPEDWQPTYDYWGAKCFSDDTSWSAPKYGTIFDGDSADQYQAFDSSDAIQKYGLEITALYNKENPLTC